MSKVQSGVVRIDNMEKYLCTMIKHFRAIFGEKCREIFIKELLINASYACIKKVSSLLPIPFLSIIYHFKLLILLLTKVTRRSSYTYMCMQTGQHLNNHQSRSIVFNENLTNLLNCFCFERFYCSLFIVHLSNIIKQMVRLKNKGIKKSNWPNLTMIEKLCKGLVSSFLSF